MLAAKAGRVDGLTDEELIELVVEGRDRSAFDALYERYFPRVYAFVSRRLGNRADVEETVQETFFGVFAGLASFRREGAFAAWVLGIARRTVAGRFKRKRLATVPIDELREVESLEGPAPGSTREPTPLEIYECEERLARLRVAAEEDLSEEQRRVFELHHLEHVSIDQIARLVDKSADSVKSHLYRARRLLLAR